MLAASRLSACDVSGNDAYGLTWDTPCRFRVPDGDHRGAAACCDRYDALRDASPRHAMPRSGSAYPRRGRGGHLGREELDVIAPVLDALRREGMRLEGPLPADTAFLPRRLAGFDAVVAMYHDQGLPVLKYSGFERAVNLTLGLPYPRVAVDHGTALDLAGTGQADPSSLYAAIETCTRLARPRRLRRAG